MDEGDNHDIGAARETSNDDGSRISRGADNRGDNFPDVLWPLQRGRKPCPDNCSTTEIKNSTKKIEKHINIEDVCVQSKSYLSSDSSAGARSDGNHSDSNRLTSAQEQADTRSSSSFLDKAGASTFTPDLSETPSGSTVTPFSSKTTDSALKIFQRRQGLIGENLITSGPGASRVSSDSSPSPIASLFPVCDITIKAEKIADLSILEEKEEGVPIVQRIYFRAAKDLHSNDAEKIRHARMMLHRLREAGFEPRPKAMSHPSAEKCAGIPSITVTLPPQSPKKVVDTSRAHDSPQSDCSENYQTSVNREIFLESVDAKAMKDGLNNGSKNPLAKRLSGSSSDPNLYRKNDMTASSLLDAMETARLSKRKDSVVRIGKRSSVPTTLTRRRKSSVTSQQFARMNGRRHSSRDILSGINGQVSPLPPDLGGSEEPDFVSWSNLLASIPKDERRTAQIRRHHVVISIPVCVIGKENPVTFTSLEAIEQTLRRLYPEVLVKKRGSQEQDDTLGKLDLVEDHVDFLESKQSITKEPRRDRRLSVVALSDKRRMSINTCIATMQKDADNYDKQLTGVKSVGSFAEEETLKVLFAKSDAIRCIIDAMKSFPEKEELQLNACASLFKMASASESNCVHILQNDGISAITSTLRKHRENVDIVRMLLKTVAYISTAVDLAPQLVAGGLHSEILSVMSRHSSDNEIVRESCFIIGNLLVTVEAAHQLMLIGGVHTIISMVEKYPDDEKILENACRTLGSFAIYDETCLDVATAGATRTVINAMKSQCANAAVVECGCWALASLSANDSTCEELVRLEGIDVIVNVLAEYPQEENIQEYGIRVLCNLSSCESTVRFVCSETAASLLQKVLVGFPESVELLEITLITLSHIMMGEAQLHKSLADSHCVQDIVHTMMSLPDNPLLQEHGCKVIGNMAVHDDLRKQVEADGASKAVISAMLTLDTVADIQEVGCLAIMNLTADNKDNKVRIKNAGAVPTLLNTLREFDTDANIVLCALKALGNLVSLEEVCHLLLDEHGLDTVVSLVEIHESNSDILVFIALVLCGVTELPDLKEEEATLIDRTLMGILSSIQNNPDVSLYVCQAIENLVRTDVGRGTFMKENRMGVILSAMNTFTDNSHIHRCCCKVIAVVALYVDTKKRLITETTLKAVLKSMELFPMDVELQIIGCGTISCIVEKTAILKHELIGQGGISLISKSVNTHLTESRLAVVALMALGHVVPIDVRTYPNEAKIAFDTILQCMSNFPENKELQISACNALRLCEFAEKEEDVHRLIKSIAVAIRRHGVEAELQKAAVSVLRPYYKSGKYKTHLDLAMNSPTVKLKNFFWDSVKEK